MDLSDYFQAGHGELIATEPRVEGKNIKFSIVQREPGLFERMFYNLKHPFLYFTGKTDGLMIYSGRFRNKDSGEEIKEETVWEDVESVFFEGAKHLGINVRINIVGLNVYGTAPSSEKRVIGIIDINFQRLEMKVRSPGGD